MPRDLKSVVCATVLCALTSLSALAAEGEWQPPEALKAWRDAAYTQRYFIEVRPLGAAGAGSRPDPETASLMLPLKHIAAGGANRLEPVLLIGEDGGEHPVTYQPAGSDTAVIFSSRSGLRRFCLYSGATKPEAKQSAVQALETPPPRVKMRAATASADFVYAEGKPLTLDRFQGLEGAGLPALGSRFVPMMSDAENPFFKITVGIFGHVTGVLNPERYVGVYEGFLRTPAHGLYKFSVDTPGAAHLLIDGLHVVAMDTPDLKRLPFAVTGEAQLAEGIHRVKLYYADPFPNGQTSALKQLFGVRLHWQPPYAREFLCIPPQAFVAHLPAVVMRAEAGNNSPVPFVALESLGQVLTGAHRGDVKSCERTLLVARAAGIMPNAIIRLAAPGQPDAVSAPAGFLAAWVPAGKEIKISLVAPENNQAVLSRSAVCPVLGKTNPDLMDLEGELAVKSAPEFLYPDETGQIHLEALLSPKPVIVFKERLESNFLPPPARPMGQFRLAWALQDSAALSGAPKKTDEIKEMDATPTEGGRRKLRVPLEAGVIAERAKTGLASLVLRLAVGEAEVETLSLRLLHSTAAWPGTIQAGPDHLLFSAAAPSSTADAAGTAAARSAGVSPAPGGAPERVMMLVPKEDESEYRKFAPLKKLTRGAAAKDGLFLGDPLVESVAPKPNAGELFGVAQTLAKLAPSVAWKGICIPGPHRYQPVFRMLADLEAYSRAQPGGALPPLAVVCLGAGDAARQTPLHTFERALDVIINRLRISGVRTIVFAGPLPEPGREKQCEPYQERAGNVARAHHVDCLDLLNTWLAEKDWVKRFALDGAGNAPLFSATPNAPAREEIARMIKERL